MAKTTGTKQVREMTGTFACIAILLACQFACGHGQLFGGQGGQQDSPTSFAGAPSDSLTTTTTTTPDAAAPTTGGGLNSPATPTGFLPPGTASAPVSAAGPSTTPTLSIAAAPDLSQQLNQSGATGSCSDGGGASHSLFGQAFRGTATRYGTLSPTGGGACSFSFQNAFERGAWSAGITTPVALTSNLWDGSYTCGQCLEFAGDGFGLGRDPLSSATQYAMVTNECPNGCGGSWQGRYNELDIEQWGDGKWGVNWHPVQCNTGSAPFQYSWQGSNPYYLKMQISNTRVPVASVTYNGIQMQRSGDGYWLIASGGPYHQPARLVITSVLGDTVTDTVPDSGYSGLSTGGAQFPSHPEYGTVGSPSSSGPANPSSVCGKADLSSLAAAPTTPVTATFGRKMQAFA